jgi:hypothetical protein
MSEAHGREVPVAFAEGVREDVASLVKSLTSNSAEAEALKRRIAELLIECKGTPYVRELMGSGRHTELASCRRIRFDIPAHKGKPRFRIIYRNEPSDGAPAECRWLAVAPRASLHAHRRATQRLRRTS